MAKNNFLIKQYKAMQKVIDNTSPNIYAGIALALHRRYGWGYKRIKELFYESQCIWEDCANNGVDMGKLCEDETGIDVRLKK